MERMPSTKHCILDMIPGGFFLFRKLRIPLLRRHFDFIETMKENPFKKMKGILQSPDEGAMDE